MTEFADALNKQNRAEMALSGAEATDKLKSHHDGRIDALERTTTQFKAELAALQKQVDKLKASMEDVSSLWHAAAAAPGALPAAPATDTDPTA